MGRLFFFITFEIEEKIASVHSALIVFFTPNVAALLHERIEVSNKNPFMNGLAFLLQSVPADWAPHVL